MLLRCALVLTLVAFVGSQERRPSTSPDRWIDAVQHHAAGNDDASVSRLAAWPLDDLQFALSAFRKLGRADTNAMLERAAVLHADIAMLRRIPGGYNLPDNGPRGPDDPRR